MIDFPRLSQFDGIKMFWAPPRLTGELKRVSRKRRPHLENADLENADLANKDLENTDVSQTQKQPLLASVMNLSPLVRLFFFFWRSAFSRSVVCVFEVCVFETPLLRSPMQPDDLFQSRLNIITRLYVWLLRNIFPL